MIRNLTYRLIVVFLLVVSWSLHAMEERDVRAATPPLGSSRNPYPDQESIPGKQGSKEKVWYRMSFYKGKLGIVVATTLGSVWLIRQQHKFAEDRRRDNVKRKLEGQEPLPEEWFFKSWIKRGMALFKRA